MKLEAIYSGFNIVNGIWLRSIAPRSEIHPQIRAECAAITKTETLAQYNTSISSPDFKKKDKIETKSLNIINVRFNMSMQREPGLALRPYLKTRSFRWRARAPRWSPQFFDYIFPLPSVIPFDL
jgi:hypothetical protein